MKRKTIAVRLDLDLVEKIKIQAVKENRSVSDIISELVRAYLESKPL